MYGTGFFPAERFEVYEVVDEGLYLTGTSEVALAGLPHGRDPRPRRAAAPLHGVLDQLPPRGRRRRPRTRAVCSASTSSTRSSCSPTCFPRSRGPSTSGCWRSRSRSRRSSASPIGVVNIEAGELSASAAKRYDLEAWFPSQQRYRELTSASNTTDYPVAPPRHPLPRERPHRVRAHAERHSRHRPLGAGRARELPGRGARGAAAVRRSRPHRVLAQGWAGVSFVVIRSTFETCPALRSSLYRYARLLGDGEALASGDPKRIERRAKKQAPRSHARPLGLLEDFVAVTGWRGRLTVALATFVAAFAAGTAAPAAPALHAAPTLAAKTCSSGYKHRTHRRPAEVPASRPVLHAPL